MRLPQSWDDTALNEDEPFASAFMARRAYLSSGRRRSDVFLVQDESAWLADVAKELEKNDALDAAQAWLHSAFAAGPGEHKVIKRRTFSVSIPEDRKLFVEFFWGVYQAARASSKHGRSNVPNPRSLLNGIRKGEGYQYQIEDKFAASQLKRFLKKIGGKREKHAPQDNGRDDTHAARFQAAAAPRKRKFSGGQDGEASRPAGLPARSSADPLDVIDGPSAKPVARSRDKALRIAADKKAALDQPARDTSESGPRKGVKNPVQAKGQKKKSSALPKHIPKRRRTEEGFFPVDMPSIPNTINQADEGRVLSKKPHLGRSRPVSLQQTDLDCEDPVPPPETERAVRAADKQRADGEQKKVKKPRLTQPTAGPAASGRSDDAAVVKPKTKAKASKSKEKPRKILKPQLYAQTANEPVDGNPSAQPGPTADSRQVDVPMTEATESSTSTVEPPSLVPKASRKRARDVATPTDGELALGHDGAPRALKKLPGRAKQPKAPPHPQLPTESVAYTHEEAGQETIDRELQNIGAQALEYHRHDSPAHEILQWDDGDGDEEKTYIEDHLDEEYRTQVGPAEVPESPTRIVVERETAGAPPAAESEPLRSEEQVLPLPPKPALHVRPPIWAVSRQEVCESLDWFRSYQGGVYTAQDGAKGYLLSAFAASRDVFAHDGRLIISHGGGKAEALHSKSGQLHRQTAANQLAEDKSVRALLKNWQTGQTIVLLADDKYALFPYDLATPGYTYVVLGRYRIVHAWAEYQPNGTEASRVIRYKFAFEWCGEQGTPWWCPDTQHGASNPEIDPRLHAILPHQAPDAPVFEASHATCAACGQASPRVYEQGWMCLRPECSAFWSIGGAEPASDTLSYDGGFLDVRNQAVARDPAYDVEASGAPDPSEGVVTSRRFTRGMHCEMCGRLSCRSRWDGWECSSCGGFRGVAGAIRSHKDFWAQQTQLGILHHKVTPGSGILVGRTMTMYNQDGSQQASYQTFTFPEGRGKIHHIQGSQLVNREANEIFRQYQEQARDGELKFRRFPLRNHKCRGELLTNYFSQNTGAPYQYVGGADHTVPLEIGPPAVLSALRLVAKRVKQLLGLDAHFNEVLSAAYMEQQRMAFHSDAERGLGSVVAGLSLGSTALMHFRLHSQFIPPTAQKANRSSALTIALRHGDILVMEGHDVQKYYEHTVVPVNFRIAATARSISPDNYRPH